MRRSLQLRCPCATPHSSADICFDDTARAQITAKLHERAVFLLRLEHAIERDLRRDAQEVNEILRVDEIRMST
jgi:hypothetical protein